MSVPVNTVELRELLSELKSIKEQETALELQRKRTANALRQLLGWTDFSDARRRDEFLLDGVAVSVCEGSHCNGDDAVVVSWRPLKQIV